MTAVDTGIAGSIDPNSGSNDPTITAVGGVYTAMWNVYMNDELKYSSTSPFLDLNDQAFLNDLKGQLLDRVRKYLHPLFGGPDGEGWDVGQSLFVSGLFAVIQPLVGDAGLIEGLSVAPDVPRSQAEQNLIKINMSASVGLPLLDYELVCSAPDEHQVINVTPQS